jgi:regulator of sirC expression with transglutaminase-like and TPR domain
MEADGDRVILDPFEPGRILEASDLRDLFKRLAGKDAELESKFFDPVGNREILLRLQNNIKSRALRSGDVVRAAAALKSMIRVAPDHVNGWYELGLLEAQADNLRAAITALETFLDKATHDIAKHHAATMIQELHAKLN